MATFHTAFNGDNANFDGFVARRAGSLFHLLAGVVGVGGLVDEGHAVVVHTVEDVTHRGVLRLLAVAEDGDAGILWQFD